jgi:hypothetical protein
MKKFITILVLLLSLQSYTQSTLDSIPNITETERIIDKYGSKISDGFNKMVENVAPMAEAGFTMVVKLQIAKGVAYMLIPLLSVLFWIMFFTNYKLALINQKNENIKDWCDASRGTPAIVGLILAIITSTISLFTIYHGLLYLIAPEWFAIKEILNLI